MPDSLDLDALRLRLALDRLEAAAILDEIEPGDRDLIVHKTRAVLVLVEEQRDRIAALEKRVGPFDPETETCQECGHSFPTVWHVHNEAWTAATGYGGNDDGGCFCIDCFQRKHDATGRPFLHWEAREGAWPSCAGSPCPEEETMVRQGEWLEREHTEIRRLQSENERLRETPPLWECPDCAFEMHAQHTDPDGGYSCPQCVEAALRDRISTLEEAVKLAAVDLAIVDYASDGVPVVQGILNRLGEALAGSPADTKEATDG